MVAGDSQQFTVTALDGFGNSIRDLTFSFQTEDAGGLVDSQGRFTAGITAGVYNDVVRVEVTDGSITKTATLNITIEPGPLFSVVAEPAETTLEVGAVQTFTFTALDRFGNEIPGLAASWTTLSSVGDIDAEGMFTAGTTAGAYGEVITVEMTQGMVTKSASAEVNVHPGPLDSVIVSLAQVKVVPGQQQQFQAAAVDSFGNEIEGVEFVWKAGDEGTIDANGLFTAGSVSGRYLKNIEAAVKNDQRVIGTASVDVPLSGLGIATIDGESSEGEWTGAGRLDFDAHIPEGDPTPASLFVMNDATNLYLGLMIERSSLGGSTNPSFEFDNDNDGTSEPGDDFFGTSVGVFQAAEFLDGFRTPCDGAEPGTAGCGGGDFSEGGTNDGMVAGSNDGSFTFVELSHPLDSADDLHDFSLGAGDSVGFFLLLGLFSLDPGEGERADTYVPGPGFRNYWEIVIADTTNPGPISSLVVDPAAVTLDIGATQQFRVRAFDQFGNEVSGFTTSWDVGSDIGASTRREF